MGGIAMKQAIQCSKQKSLALDHSCKDPWQLLNKEVMERFPNSPQTTFWPDGLVPIFQKTETVESSHTKTGNLNCSEKVLGFWPDGIVPITNNPKNDPHHDSRAENCRNEQVLNEPRKPKQRRLTLATESLPDFEDTGWRLEETERAEGESELGQTERKGKVGQIFGPENKGPADRDIRRQNRGRWFWIRSDRVLQAAELGFPASEADVKRFGHRATTLIKAKERKVDSRSFVQVLRGEMQRDLQKEFGQGVPRQRSQERGNRGFFEGRISEERRRFDENRGPREPDRYLGRDFYREGQGQSDRDNFRGNYRRSELEEKEYRSDKGRWEAEKTRALEKENQGNIRSQNISGNLSGKRPSEESDFARNDRGEQELRSKLMREQDDRYRGESVLQRNPRERFQGEGSSQGTNSRDEPFCFNCNQSGHIKLQCTRPTFCYHCKNSGHKATICPYKRGLRVCALGFPGQGFYSFHIPPNKNAPKQVMGMMTIEKGTASVEIVETEMIYLYRGKRNWKIKQMNENEFLINFPTEEMRFELTKFKRFEFITVENQAIVAKVVPTDLSPDSTGSLELVWVKAFNMPPSTRTPEAATEVAFLAGDPQEVDESSLNKPGPVRFRLYCRDSNLLKGETEIFINGEGHKIDWVVEQPSKQEPQMSKSAPSRFDRRRGTQDDEGDRESSYDDSNKGFQASLDSNLQSKGRGGNTSQTGGRQHMEQFETSQKQVSDLETHQRFEKSSALEEGEIEGISEMIEDNKGDVDDQNQHEGVRDMSKIRGDDEMVEVETVYSENDMQEQIEKFEERTSNKKETNSLEMEIDYSGAKNYELTEIVNEDVGAEEFDKYGDEQVDYDLEPTPQEREEMARIEAAFELRTQALAPLMSFNLDKETQSVLEKYGIQEDIFAVKESTNNTQSETYLSNDFIEVKRRNRPSVVRAERKSSRSEENGEKIIQKACSLKQQQNELSEMEGAIEAK